MVSKKDDFYANVNKIWLDETEIPDNESRWGSFNILEEENLNKIQLLLKNNINCPNTDIKKLCYLYFQSLNNTSKEPKEIVKTFLEEINNIKNKLELQKFINNKFFLYDLSTPVNYYVDLDLHSPNYILHVDTAGLGLPDKEYYLDDKYKDMCTEYKTFMSNTV